MTATKLSYSPLGEYLWARRACTSPEQVGLHPGKNRRVPGLRRDEVARLACISPDYYLRIEQGYGHEPSDAVLRGIARALLLDAAGERHLRRLRELRSDLLAPVAPADASSTLAESARRLLAGFCANPAFVLSSNLDVLCVNRSASELGDCSFRADRNLVEEAFRVENEDRRDAARLAAGLRFHGNPYDARFQQVVGALALRNAAFRAIWTRHDVSPLRAVSLRIPSAGSHSSAIGFACFETPSHPGLLLAVAPETSTHGTGGAVG